MFRTLVSASLMMVALCAMAQNSHLCVLHNGSVAFRTPAGLVDSIVLYNNSRQVKLIDASGNTLYTSLRSRVDSIAFMGGVSYPAFNMSTRNQLDGSHDPVREVYSFLATGGDPYLYTQALTSDMPSDSCVLTFDYQSPQGVDDLQVFFCNKATGYYATEASARHMGAVPATSGEEWKTFSYSVSSLREQLNWGKAGDRIRVDWGTQSGTSVKVMNFRFRGMTQAEEKARQKADSIARAKETMNAHLQNYLDTVYANTIASVKVTADKVEISGSCQGDESCMLVEIPPYVDLTETRHFSVRIPLTEKTFTVSQERMVWREGCLYDRLLSKWAIVRQAADGDVLASHARYADEVMPRFSAQPGILTGKKGLGAGGGAVYYQDFDQLHACCITMNIVLNAFLYKNSMAEATAYQFGGKTYYVNNNAVAQMDAMLTEAQQRNINVSAIILASTGSIFNDPENTGGYYTMPNMTTAEAVNDYAAALNYLAERYSSGEHGRIHHWIMHNEVDQGMMWTNMGEQPELRYNDRYVKSLRLCYNIVRQYDQHASVLGSYTHNWNVKLGETEYSPKRMLEQMVRYSDVEGDFRWGVACHPYPVNLEAPAYWSDDASRAVYSMDSRYVTFHNPEVINAWIKTPAHYYKGTEKRMLFFSENGTNSRDYSENQLTLQAAGAALIWKKVKQLDGIDGIMWHNWKDNKAEFGLRIGLRAFEDGSFKEYDVKPSWKVWQAADTDDEDKVFSPYLEVLGLSDWNNIIHEVK